MRDISTYKTKRGSTRKNNYVSTENLLQNCAGLEPYDESSEITGIAFSQKDMLVANIRPYLKKAWFATFDGVCSSDVLAITATSIDSAFLHHIIANDNFFKYVMSGVKGSKMPRGDKAHMVSSIFLIRSAERFIRVAP